MALRAPTALLLGPVPLAWAAAVAGVARRTVAARRAPVGRRRRLRRRRRPGRVARRAVRCTNCRVDGSCSSRRDGAARSRSANPSRRCSCARAFGGSVLPPAGSPALDLTQGAFGLALQLDLVEPTDMLVPRGRSTTETVHGRRRCSSRRPDPRRCSTKLGPAASRSEPALPRQRAGPPPSTSSPS